MSLQRGLVGVFAETVERVAPPLPHQLADPRYGAQMWTDHYRGFPNVAKEAIAAIRAESAPNGYYLTPTEHQIYANMGDLRLHAALGTGILDLSMAKDGVIDRRKEQERRGQMGRASTCLNAFLVATDGLAISGTGTQAEVLAGYRFAGRALAGNARDADGNREPYYIPGTHLTLPGAVSGLGEYLHDTYIRPAAQLPMAKAYGNVVTAIEGHFALTTERRLEAAKHLGGSMLELLAVQAGTLLETGYDPTALAAVRQFGAAGLVLAEWSDVLRNLGNGRPTFATKIIRESDSVSEGLVRLQEVAGDTASDAFKQMKEGLNPTQRNILAALSTPMRGKFWLSRHGLPWGGYPALTVRNVSRFLEWAPAEAL